MDSERSDSGSESRILRRRRLLSAAGVGLTASLAGCGSDGSGADPDDDQGSDNSTDATSESGSGGEETTGDDDNEEPTGPASYEIASVDHPDEVRIGEEHTSTVRVENTGGEDGAFTGTLEARFEGSEQWTEIEEVRVEVPGGETATWESTAVPLSRSGTVQFRIGETEWNYSVVLVAPETQSFAGRGDATREAVPLEAGLTIARATHSGQGDFSASVLGGQTNAVVVFASGSFDGAGTTTLEAGSGYLLNVSADGDWEVELEQPRSAEGEPLPASYSGQYKDVVGPIRFDGATEVRGEHSGDDQFNVILYSEEGSEETVFAESGSVSSETSVAFEGVGWVDVRATGEWSLELR